MLQKRASRRETPLMVRSRRFGVLCAIAGIVGAFSCTETENETQRFGVVENHSALTFGSLRAEYHHSSDPNPTDNNIQTSIRIQNDSTTDVSLEEVTLKYWYTSEGTGEQAVDCYWAQLQCSSLILTTEPSEPAAPGADSLFEIGFSPSAGTLGAGQNTGEIMTRIHSVTWAAYDENDDYSYIPGQASWADAPHIAVYYQGALVWGTEPEGFGGGGGSTCYDNKKNGDESDVDCGGDVCPKCQIGMTCDAYMDCESSRCIDAVCAPPNRIISCPEGLQRVEGTDQADNFNNVLPNQCIDAKGDNDSINDQAEGEGAVLAGDGADTMDITGPSLAAGGRGPDNINATGPGLEIYGEDGNDAINVNNADAPIVHGGDGNDQISLNATSGAVVSGGQGDDTLNITGDNIEINGNAGDDTINANGDNISVNPGTGKDTVTVNGNGAGVTVFINDICELDCNESYNGNGAGSTLVIPVPLDDILARGVTVNNFVNIIVDKTRQNLSPCATQSNGWAMEVVRIDPNDPTVPPGGIDFDYEEGDRGDKHLSPAALASGMEIQWEDELDDFCTPVMPVGSLKDGFLQAAAAGYANLQASALNLTVSQTDHGTWRERTGDPGGDYLWGDPRTDWTCDFEPDGTPISCDGSPTLRVVLIEQNAPLGNFSGNFPDPNDPIGASGFLRVWNPLEDGGAGAWGAANRLDPSDSAFIEYAVVPLKKSDFRAGVEGRDIDKCPTAESVAHEIGHAFGFTEQRLRKTASLSRLENPTAMQTLWAGVSPFERDPYGKLRHGAYAQSFLHYFYGADTLAPGVQWEDDWVMQNIVVRLDQTQPNQVLPQPEHPDPRSVPRSCFQVPEINPQHLVYNSETRKYVDCVTNDTPIYFAHYSEVSYADSNCSTYAYLDYVLVDPVTNQEVRLARHIENNTCSADAMWEYQHSEPLVINDCLLSAAGVTPPTEANPTVTVHLEMRIRPNYAFSESNPDDNRVQMPIVLHHDTTTDSKCAAQHIVARAPDTEGRFGKVVAATTPSDIRNTLWTATGSPYRSDSNGVSQSGEVVMQKWDKNGISIVEQTLSAQESGEGFGYAVSVDSNWLVVGAPFADGGDGRAYLYSLSGDSWDYKETLVPAGATGQAGSFGFAVSVHKFGANTLVFVGEPDWDDMGRVAVYKVPSDGSTDAVRIGGLLMWETGARFGAALATSGDTLLVGAPYADGIVENTGVVNYYNLDASGTTLGGILTFRDKLSPSSSQSGDDFGFSVAIYQDALVVGAPHYNASGQPNSGAAYVYGRQVDSSGDYILAARIDLSDAPGGAKEGDFFGYSVAIYRGNILVGAPRRNLNAFGRSYLYRAGAAFLYSPLKTEDFSIRRVFDRPAYDDGVRRSGDRLGTGVALGDRLYFIGAPQADSKINDTYVDSNIGALRVGPYRTFDWVR